jgi:hypothetical protein
MFDIVGDMKNVFEQQKEQYQKNGYEYLERFYILQNTFFHVY